MSQFTEYATAAWRFSTRISLATGGNYHHGSALVATGASNFKRLRLSGELHSCTIRWYDPMAREVEEKKSERRSQREVKEKPEEVKEWTRWNETFCSKQNGNQNLISPGIGILLQKRLSQNELYPQCGFHTLEVAF